MAPIHKSLAFILAIVPTAPALAQLAATISVETTSLSEGGTRYEYVVENLPESTLMIDVLLLDVALGSDPASIEQPTGWSADYAPGEPNLRLGWVAEDGSEIPIGGSGTFSFTSTFAPGEIEVVIGDLLPDLSDFEDVLFDFIEGPLMPPLSGIAGDYNGNGQVEQADLDLVLLNWGADGTIPPESWINDLPEDVIDQAELDGVLLNWGSMAELGSASVPEPSAWLLVIGCAVGLKLRRAAPARQGE